MSRPEGAPKAAAITPPAPAPAAPQFRVSARILAWLRAAMGLVGLSPWLLPLARAKLGLGDAGVALDLVFFTMCHRRAARTLVFEGVAMPLCSRCAGIFLGVAVGALIARPILPLRTWRWAFAAACALLLTDVVTQDLGLHPVWHTTRIATGVLVGYGMVVGFLSGLARDHKSSAADGKTSSAAP